MLNDFVSGFDNILQLHSVRSSNPLLLDQCKPFLHITVRNQSGYGFDWSLRYRLTYFELEWCAACYFVVFVFLNFCS
jgi:hypothetical protein